MAYGAIKRDKRKTRRRAGWTDYSTGNVLKPHRATIKLSVFRTYGQRGGDYPRQGDYTAVACFGGAVQSAPAKRQSGRCVRATGPSPTRAVKRAVVSLMKKIK